MEEWCARRLIQACACVCKDREKSWLNCSCMHLEGWREGGREGGREGDNDQWEGCILYIFVRRRGKVY